MIGVVLDTSVLYSAILKRTGNPAELFDLDRAASSLLAFHQQCWLNTGKCFPGQLCTHTQSEPPTYWKS